MNRQEYLGELRDRLRYRAAPRQRTDEIVAEVEGHLVESGEDPLESFGPPDRDAARLLRNRWHTARYVVGMTAGVAAGLLVGGAAAAHTAGEPAVSVPGGSVLIGVAILLACGGWVLPVVHNWLPRSTIRLLVAIALAGFVTVAGSVVGATTGLDERVAFTLSPAAALAAAAGLFTVTVAMMAGPYLWRWLRGGAAGRLTGSG